MELFICVFVGYIAGIITSHILRPKRSGFLRIDHSDPTDSPYFFLELTRDLEVIKDGSEVTFEVKVKDFIPRN